MEQRQMAGKNLPEKKIAAGPISATIWKNMGQGRDGAPVEFRTIQVERRYKDKNGQWQGTSSFRLNDLPRAMIVMQKAYEYLVLQDSKATTGVAVEAEEEDIIM